MFLQHKIMSVMARSIRGGTAVHILIRCIRLILCVCVAQCKLSTMIPTETVHSLVLLLNVVRTMNMTTIFNYYLLHLVCIPLCSQVHVSSGCINFRADIMIDINYTRSRYVRSTSGS